MRPTPLTVPDDRPAASALRAGHGLLVGLQTEADERFGSRCAVAIDALDRLANELEFVDQVCRLSYAEGLEVPICQRLLARLSQDLKQLLPAPVDRDGHMCSLRKSTVSSYVLRASRASKSAPIASFPLGGTGGTASESRGGLPLFSPRGSNERLGRPKWRESRQLGT
jgi:hypothetical protein